MPGAIVGIYGVQRSGKTLIAYKLVKGLQQACKPVSYTHLTLRR